MLHLCILHGIAECEDPRDKVYGLHSLANKCCKLAVPVDYSLVPNELFKRLLIHHLDQGPGHLPRGIHSFPTDAFQLQMISDVQMFQQRLLRPFRSLVNQPPLSSLVPGVFKHEKAHATAYGYARGKLSSSAP